MVYSPDISRDWKATSFSSPGPEDTGRLRIENNQLKLQVKQLTADLQAEQGTGVTSQFHKINGNIMLFVFFLLYL